MLSIHRSLNLENLLSKKSHFLFGPRGTGKTFLIQQQISDAFIIDLLDHQLYSRLLRKPEMLSELIPDNKKIVVIDEVQRIPELLNEVHRLIEKKRLRFLLTGSSARKLKRGAANLLAGRAWEARLMPLTWFELKKNFDLLTYLNRGGLPAIYFSEFFMDELNNYSRLYVKEEIQAEAIVKRLDHFVRFMDIAALANLEEINFDNISNDSGVPSRTVASYYEILSDTLLGFQLHSFQKTIKRKAVKRSKFVFFDVGVIGALAKRGAIKEKGEVFGRAFEHFIIQEVRAFLSYTNKLDTPLQYWRSSGSQFEVDLIVGDQLAIEIKSTEQVSEKHLSGLKALAEEKLIKKYMIVSQDKLKRKHDFIEVLPWDIFLEQLWMGELL